MGNIKTHTLGEVIPLFFLALIIIVGMIYYITTKNTPDSELERQNDVSNERLVLGNSIQAITNPISDHYLFLIAQYDWNVDIAYQIMLCESQKNPNAVNWNDIHNGCRGSFGLMQVACVHNSYFESIDELYIPEVNIEIAYEIYQKQGFNAWRNCLKRI